MSPNAGVYEIVNTANGRRYIGSSANIAARFKTHRYELSRGEHHSAKLQRSWNKHGADAFSFRTLLVCSPEDSLFFEQRCLDAYKPELNIATVAGKKTMLGRKHSAATLAKMSAAKLGNTATRGKPRNPEAVKATADAHRGMKRSELTRARISARRSGAKMPARTADHRRKLSESQRGRGRFSDSEISQIKLRAAGGERHPEIARDLGVCRPLISMICSGKRYRWVP